MKKMLISLVIEGNEEDIHGIKGQILSICSEAVVSVNTTEIEEPKKEIKCHEVNTDTRSDLKRMLNSFYGSSAFAEPKVVIVRSDRKRKDL